MKTELACLSLAACLFTSCDKSGTETSPAETSSKNPQMETRAAAPTIAEKPAPARRVSPGADNRNTNNPTINHPTEAEMIRPAGTAPEDGSWETLTAEQMIEKFRSSGIARIPKDVSDKILSDATSAGTPEDQVHFITQQAAAWHHINKFRESNDDIPEHMKLSLLEKLSKRHGDSWKDMATELDEQVAASARVMEFRLNGIPGMSPDESQDLLINALEKHGPDYKTVLSIANQNAGK